MYYQVPSQEGQSPYWQSNVLSPLEMKRVELERGAGGDHDLPYNFALPHAWPQVSAWMRLLVKVHNGELQL